MSYTGTEKGLPVVESIQVMNPMLYAFLSPYLHPYEVTIVGITAFYLPNFRGSKMYIILD